MENCAKHFSSGFLIAISVFGNCGAMESRRTCLKTSKLIVASSITLGSIAVLNSYGVDSFKIFAMTSTLWASAFVFCGYDRLWNLLNGTPNQENHNEDFMTTDRIAAIDRLKLLQVLEGEIYSRICKISDVRIQAYKTSDLLKLKYLDEQIRALISEQHDLETQKDRLINGSMVIRDDI